MCLNHAHTTDPMSASAETQIRNPGRRRFLIGLAGVGGAMLVGCVEPGDTGFGISLVSPEQARQLGLESWEQIRRDTRPSDNATYQRALQKVGSDVLRAAGQDPSAWELVVFEGDEANAFALPGGKIGVFEGMFRHARNEDQLAAVIGHEIGHNQAEHAAERLSSAAATQTGLQLIDAALRAGNIGYVNEVAALLGAGVQYGLILPYGRNQELEADRLGLFNMARAGYDPRAAIELWRNMQDAGPRQPGFLSTHPAPDARIVALEQLMPEAMALYQAQG